MAMERAEYLGSLPECTGRFGCIISYMESLLQFTVMVNKLEHLVTLTTRLEPLWNSAESPNAAGEIINLGFLLYGIEEIEIREAATRNY